VVTVAPRKKAVILTSDIDGIEPLVAAAGKRYIGGAVHRQPLAAAARHGAVPSRAREQAVL